MNIDKNYQDKIIQSMKNGVRNRLHYNVTNDTLIEINTIFVDEFHMWSAIFGTSYVKINEESLFSTRYNQYFRNYILNDLYYMGYVSIENFQKLQTTSFDPSLKVFTDAIKKFTLEYGTNKERKNAGYIWTNNLEIILCTMVVEKFFKHQEIAKQNEDLKNKEKRSLAKQVKDTFEENEKVPMKIDTKNKENCVKEYKDNTESNKFGLHIINTMILPPSTTSYSILKSLLKKFNEKDQKIISFPLVLDEKDIEHKCILTYVDTIIEDGKQLVGNVYIADENIKILDMYNNTYYLKLIADTEVVDTDNCNWYFVLLDHNRKNVKVNSIQYLIGTVEIEPPTEPPVIEKVEEKKEIVTEKSEKYISWTNYFMGIAKLVRMRSKDPSCKVGACIVRDNKVLSTGYNGFPIGISDKDYPWTKGSDDPTKNKYFYVVHAELNAILNSDNPVNGSTLFVTKFPCNECVKAIIQAGIKRVVFDDEMKDKELMSDPLIYTAYKMLSDAGITVERYQSINIGINIEL